MPIGVPPSRAAVYVIDGGKAQAHHRKGVEHPYRVGQANGQSPTIAAERLQRRHLDPGGSPHRSISGRCDMRRDHVIGRCEPSRSWVSSHTPFMGETIGRHRPPG
jgi:hypothetical protein